MALTPCPLSLWERGKIFFGVFFGGFAAKKHTVKLVLYWSKGQVSHLSFLFGPALPHRPMRRRTKCGMLKA
ncbi:MAG: hypothetical protein FOGNACKC_04003 [Anaerolineae bacterium]|nr:hypothetical protein [Anaerolineae bacterium]